MALVTDGNGTRWVEMPAKPRRASPRALKFAALKVGDQIMQKPRESFYRKIPVYYIVTDLWFDPVAGQRDATAGQMVGYAQVRDDGSIWTKSKTTIRGLASQQFDYADQDFIAMCKARTEALSDGDIVPISMARVIRRRPKQPGSRL